MFEKPTNEEALQTTPAADLGHGGAGKTPYGVAQIVNGWLAQENLLRTRTNKETYETYVTLVALEPQKVYGDVKGGRLVAMEVNGKLSVPNEDAAEYVQRKYAQLFAQYASDPANEGRYDHLLKDTFAPGQTSDSALFEAPDVENLDLEDIEVEDGVEDEDES